MLLIKIINTSNINKQNNKNKKNRLLIKIINFNNNKYMDYKRINNFLINLRYKIIILIIKVILKKNKVFRLI